MKVTLLYPDKTRRTIHLGERQKVRALLPHVPSGTYIRRRDRRVNWCRRRLLKDAFRDGEVVEVCRKVTPTGSGIYPRILKRNVPTSTDKCMITLDTNVKRGNMPCGHAITPMALYEYCVRELDAGRTRITCPYIFGEHNTRCGHRWTMDVIEMFAALTTKEKNSLKSKLAANRLHEQERKMSNIPKDKETLSLLDQCPKLNYLKPGCPQRRACPQCWTFIDHVGGCREMTCSYPSCQYRFCFICLQEYSSCDNADCSVAPRQFL